MQRTEPILDRVFGGARLGDGLDLCYIKDVAQAIAMVHTADDLRHRVYNIGWGRSTLNTELIESILQAFPGADLRLPPGRTPGPEALFMDTQRLRTETGFSPKYSLPLAVADYAGWLKAGHSR